MARRPNRLVRWTAYLYLWAEVALQITGTGGPFLPREPTRTATLLFWSLDEELHAVRKRRGWVRKHLRPKGNPRL